MDKKTAEAVAVCFGPGHVTTMINHGDSSKNNLEPAPQFIVVKEYNKGKYKNRFSGFKKKFKGASNHETHKNIINTANFYSVHIVFYLILREKTNHPRTR